MSSVNVRTCKMRTNIADIICGYDDCVRGTGPAYFKDVCVPVLDIAARSSLRSAERG